MRCSNLKFKEFVWELQDLLEIPRQVFRSSGGFRYEKPIKAQEIIQAIVKTMVNALHNGEDIQIRGFGTFKVETTAPRKHRPFLEVSKAGKIIAQSRVSVPIQSRKTVVFYPSVHLDAMINQGEGNVLSFVQKRAMKTWREA